LKERFEQYCKTLEEFHRRLADAYADGPAVRIIARGVQLALGIGLSASSNLPLQAAPAMLGLGLGILSDVPVGHRVNVSLRVMVRALATPIENDKRRFFEHQLGHGRDVAFDNLIDAFAETPRGRYAVLRPTSSGRTSRRTVGQSASGESE
jgi:hypothetical protein